MKFKKIPPSYFVTILDRLTRFEPACIRYKRVFDDIINKFSLTDKLTTLSALDEIKYVEEIFNSSLKSSNYDPYINEILTNLEEKYFNYNEESYQYLSSRLNISQMITEIEENQNLPKNVSWLKTISKQRKNLKELRIEFSLLYPIEKIILCEGQTEYTLLKTLFLLFNVDLDKIGVYVIPAGGKNQVARKYYKMIEYTKIPFFILLDKDAQAIEAILSQKIRKNDKIYLIKSGEFEDLIPKTILQKTINYVHKNEYNCIFDDFSDEFSMVSNLENIYKKYGFGEFKKAQFALELKEYIKNNLTKENFLNTEVKDIVEFFKPI